jgi:hypothetical protein
VNPTALTPRTAYTYVMQYSTTDGATGNTVTRTTAPLAFTTLAPANVPGTIAPPTLSARTDTSLSLALGSVSGMSNPRFELYDAAGTTLIGSNTTGLFTGLSPSTTYSAVALGDDLNESTGATEVKKSTPLSVTTDAPVVADRPGVASITGPATSGSGAITLTLSASDADGIASWEVTSVRKRNTGVFDPVVIE